MYCRWCGAQNPDDSSFCNKCGGALTREQYERTNPHVTTVYVGTTQTADARTQADNTIMPLTIFCILLCVVGVLSFFLTIAEARGYNSSTMQYYTIQYNGFWMLFDPDFESGGIYESLSIASRVCPLFITLIYMFLIYLFYTCFTRRPGVEFPVCLFIAFGMTFYLNFCINAVPIFENSYIRETLYSGIGVSVYAWVTLILLILGYVLSKKMEKAGFPK